MTRVRLWIVLWLVPAVKCTLEAGAPRPRIMLCLHIEAMRIRCAYRSKSSLGGARGSWAATIRAHTIVSAMVASIFCMSTALLAGAPLKSWFRQELRLPRTRRPRGGRGGPRRQPFAIQRFRRSSQCGLLLDWCLTGGVCCCRSLLPVLLYYA